MPLVVLDRIHGARTAAYRNSSLVLETWSDSKIVTLLGARVFCLTNSIFEGLGDGQWMVM